MGCSRRGFTLKGEIQSPRSWLCRARTCLRRPDERPQSFWPACRRWDPVDSELIPERSNGRAHSSCIRLQIRLPSAQTYGSRLAASSRTWPGRRQAALRTAPTAPQSASPGPRLASSHGDKLANTCSGQTGKRFLPRLDGRSPPAQSHGTEDAAGDSDCGPEHGVAGQQIGSNRCP
jgi:hypothetical protein